MMRDYRIKPRRVIAFLSVLVSYSLMIKILAQTESSNNLFYFSIVFLFLLSILLPIKKEDLNRLIVVGGLLVIIMIINSSIMTIHKQSTPFLQMVFYIGLWFFVLFSIYQYSFSEDDTNWFSILSVLYLIGALFLYSNMLYKDYRNPNGFYEITIAYYLLCALPVAFSLRNKVIKTIAIVLVFIGGIMSFKRTIMLTLAVVLLAFLLFSSKKKLLRKVLIVILSALILVIVVVSLNNQLISQIGAIWVTRFFSEGTVIGARGDVFSNVLQLLADSPVSKLLLGHGYNAVSAYSSSGLSAHNDFLEILFDYGIIAFFLYVYFIVLLIKDYRCMKKNNDQNSFPMLVSIIVFVIPSLFSHMMTYPTHFIVLSVFWGCSLSRRVEKHG